MRDFLLLTSLIFTFAAYAGDAYVKSINNDATKIEEYRERCETINTLIVKNSFKLGCFTNYNHYGPTSIKSNRVNASLKIANYNLLHPGTSKALFKDYALVAKVMGQYDIVAGLELLATVGHDEANNRAVLEFIKASPAMVEKLRVQRSKLKDAAKIQEITFKIDKLINDTRAAYDLYRAPGYLKVLFELKKLDPSWSLILSPRGDSAIEGSVEELSGFYYRASSVTPTVNPHCKEVAANGAGSPFACFISLTEDFMGKDYLHHFSRRPFMASFKANNSSFALVTSHMVYTYSGEEEAEKALMKDAFGSEDFKAPGLNSANFARFAEVKITLDFMELYRKKYNDKKIMFLADTNLVSNNAFWPHVMKSFPGGELLIKEPTTLSPGRYLSNGKETNGEANDYDHFILDKKDFSSCNNGDVFNYYKTDIYKDLESRYIIRKEVVGLSNKNLPDVNAENIDTQKLLGLGYTPMTEDDHELDGDIPPTDDPAPIKLEYPLTSAGQSKMDKFVAGFGKQLMELKTVKKDAVVVDDFQIKERLEGLNRRVFLRQLTNAYYFRFTQEILSDHFPVSITCKF